MGKKYIKCPRCELNYILEGEDYCHVCQNEMKHHDESEDDELLDFDEMDLCPVCNQNYIKEDQTMCEDCKKKKKGQADLEEDNDSSDEKSWEDDEDDDSLVSPVSDIDRDDDYNSGYEIVDGTEDDLDPYKTEDDDLLGGDTIEFSEEEELDAIEEIEPMKDDFEVVDVSDDDDEEDEEDEEDYDFEDDLLGKK